MAGELFNMMARLNMVQVHYRGGAPATSDLIGGQVQAMFIGPVASMEHIKAGRLRVLASTTASRWDGLPDVPAVSEFIPGYEASNWLGIGAPRGTPTEIITVLNRAINAALRDPKVKERVAGMGGTVIAGSPASFGKLIADETVKWGKVVKFAGMKPI
jgi:tripartite-type tricarboxylate transporter receptor subunit TctC